MNEPKPPPTIFSSARRLAARRRMAAMQRRGGAARTLAREMAEDAVERLQFVADPFPTALTIGDWTGGVGEHLKDIGAAVTVADPAGERGFDELSPIAGGPFALVVSLGLLDTINDLPGAMVLMRRALAPGGLMIASFAGAGSLPRLRAAMLTADGDRPAPRIHPQVDVRAAGQLMNRLGFAAPVVDGWGFDVAYASFDQLIADLRAQGATNVLADPGPPLTRAMRETARAAFQGEIGEGGSGEGGALTERFEVVTLSGWSSLPPRSA